MKFNIILSIIIACISLTTQAQLPFAIAHQGVICDANNQPITNSEIQLRIGIYQERNDIPIYQELNTVSTNNKGYFRAALGRGNAIIGNMQSVNWGTADHHVIIEADIDGTTNFEMISRVDLLPVPIANYALTTTRGQVGPQGPNGAKGPTGPNGAMGPSGAQGPACPQGPAGRDGEPGPPGPTGPAGASGLSGFSIHLPMSSPPSNPFTNQKYMDDGSNRADGRYGLRHFDGTRWIDL